MSKVTLRVNGREFGGWKSASVTRGIESVAGSFELSVSDRWSNAKPWPIFEGDECSVLLNGEVVLTGYVDKREQSYSAEDHSLKVSGRDRTGDLVDCSALLEKWEFKNVSLKQFVEKITEPFGIPVSLSAGVDAVKFSLPNKGKLNVDPGDTAFTAIDHACRMAGLLPVADGVGGLVLARPASARTATELVEGQNILSASITSDVTGRFHRYVVLGQHKGSDRLSGVDRLTRGEAIDENVKRTARTLVIKPEGNATAESAKARAQWEATTRAAHADAVSVTVQGWTQSTGALWPINSLVRVRSPLLGVDGDLLITQATYTVDESGTKTEFALKRPDSFKPEPKITEKATAYWREIEHGV